MYKGRIMMNSVQLATTAEFKNMSAEDRVDIFGKFTNTTGVLSGEMLEIMFQSADYTALGFKTWRLFVDEVLPISYTTTINRRKLFNDSEKDKSGIINGSSTESFLKETKKEVIEAIEAEIEETVFEAELLSSNEIQVLKDTYVPKTHHNKIKNISTEDVLSIQKRVDATGKKGSWKYYIISDDIFEHFLNKTHQSTEDGTKRTNVDQHTLDGLLHVLNSGREIDQDRWLKDKIKEVRKDIVEKSGNKLTKKAEEESEARRVSDLPTIRYESHIDLARQCGKHLQKSGASVKVFCRELRNEIKRIEENNEIHLT